MQKYTEQSTKQCQRSWFTKDKRLHVDQYADLLIIIWGMEEPIVDANSTNIQLEIEKSAKKMLNKETETKRMVNASHSSNWSLLHQTNQ